MDFSIIDIETTGFSKTYDRIIEVAIIRVNSAGEILNSYESLVNPNRDVGAIHIHGLTASSLSKAPDFKVIAQSIIDILNNSTIVAHNKNFDLGFLNSEFKRANIIIPELSGVCTLQLSKHLFPELPSRKLQVLCEYLDILVENSHEAYSDCKATMNLFLKMYESYIEDFGIDDFRSTFLDTNYFNTQLNDNAEKIEFKRSDVIDSIKKDESRMRSLLLRIPDNYKAKDYKISEYLNLIDNILEDRLISIE
jgi:DNA polymerase-3 subunit epsilon